MIFGATEWLLLQILQKEWKKIEHKEEPKRDNSTLDQANDYLHIFSFAFINI